ncbi:MAG TPA: DinB family protein [Puia sp.]|nr:DinB family protein [Puia sp.]
MRKLLFACAAFLVCSFTSMSPTLTDKERKDAIDQLAKTEQGVFNSLKGLSDAQLNFKPAADRWSISDCVKHIATTELALWQMTDAALKQPADAAKRSTVKVTDDQLLQMIENRTQKIKTSPQLEPQNSSFKSCPDALSSFYDSRKMLSDFVATTSDDMRDHVVTLPFGSFDSYQMLLFIAGHSNRHTQQIEEVKADPNFPKN